MIPPRAIVTGGTGFVGRFIVERLLAEGYKVETWGRSPPAPGFFGGHVSFRPLSLDTGPAAFEAFQSASVLVHAAFDHIPGRYRGGEGDDPEGFRRRNVAASIELFRAARQAGVARALFLSSRAVYGRQPAGAELTEDTVCRPDTLYGQCKLEVERGLSELSADGFRTASLRLTGVYGPSGRGRSNKWDSLIADWRSGRHIQPRVATEVHGADVADAVFVALEALDRTSAPMLLNVSDLLVDHADIVTVLNRLSGLNQPIPPRANAAAVNQMATARLRAHGWTPEGRALFERALAELIAQERS